MECKYCDVIKEKKNLLYEDENIIAIIPERPCTKGHIQIISKKHYNTTQEMTEKELQHLVYASSFAATALFENLGAQGTNLVMKSGSLIKKEGNHIHMDVIARNPDDGLNFLWEPKKLAESDMKDAETAIKDKADLIGVKKKKKEVVDLDKKKIGHVGGTNNNGNKQYT